MLCADKAFATFGPANAEQPANLMELTSENDAYFEQFCLIEDQAGHAPNDIGELILGLIPTGTSMPGSATVPTLEACLHLCAHTPKCKAFSYTPKWKATDTTGFNCNLSPYDRVDQPDGVGADTDETFKPRLWFAWVMSPAPQGGVKLLARQAVKVEGKTEVVRQTEATVTAGQDGWTKCVNGTQYTYKFDKPTCTDAVKCPKQVKLCPGGSDSSSD